MKQTTIRYLTLHRVSKEDVLLKVCKKLNISQEDIQIQLEAKRGVYVGFLDEQEIRVKVTTVWAMILLLLLAVFIGIGTYWYTSLDKTNRGPLVDESLLPDAGTDVVNMTEQELMDLMQQAADKDYFQLKMNTVVTFPSGKDYGEVQIVNPPNNTNPMTVEIYLKGTNEKVYSSGGILPKQYISKGKLQKSLKKGTYEALGVVRIYDENTKKEVSTTEVVMQVVVEN